jgi:hypothetical protein
LFNPLCCVLCLAASCCKKQQAPLWKKKAAPVRQKRIYKTADEVLEEAAGEGGGGAGAGRGLLTLQPILDLRGPQARLVTDLEQLNATAGAQEQLELPLFTKGS